MREIKFRGKNKAGEWMYGDLYHTNELTCICDWSIRPHTVENFAVNPETVGQFTGLYDKNGTEIYEGDVLSVTDGSCGNRSYPVVWHKSGFYVDFRHAGKAPLHNVDRKKIAIVGNIHDTPNC